jgi:hypothetical protein
LVTDNSGSSYRFVRQRPVREQHRQPQDQALAPGSCG